MIGMKSVSISRPFILACVVVAAVSINGASAFSFPNKQPALLKQKNHEDKTDGSLPFVKNFQKAAASAATAFFVFAGASLDPSTHMIPNANAIESRIIGEISGSGLVFKDTLTVESFDDPKVRGVTLYISNFQRPLTERLQKDFFSDPSFASVGCAKTGPVKIADNIAVGKQGEEVFEESKSLMFKTLRVQRIYDKEKNTVVYISFNTRLDKNSDDNKSRFKSSTCAVNLDDGVPATPAPAADPVAAKE